MGNPSLLPYETIVRATSGEPEAVDEVLRHYSKRIRIQFYVWTFLAAFQSLVIIGLPSLSIKGHTPPAAPNFVAR